MKAIRSFLSLFLILGFLSLTAQKQALVIGIGQYPSKSKWPSLSSENDIKYVKGVLDHLGFEKTHITILKNENATKINIIGAFDELIKNSNKGDFVFIHYSGHGQQIVDDNNDEIDKLDEAIVPFDSPLYYEKGVYEGENLIRDDELNRLTQKLRTKIGVQGQVIFILDSCHSGTGTRGMGAARGTDHIMGSDVNISPSEISDFDLGTVDESTLAPMACFFGSSAQELNFETFDKDYNNVGSLTYALADVITNLSEKCTFEDLFERIKKKMIRFAPNQNPKWEGPKDVLFMENSRVDLDNWIKIMNQLSDREMILEVGTLRGVFPGSKIGIYSSGTQRLLSTGNVINSQLTRSVVKLREPIPIETDKIYQAKIIEKTQAPCRIELNNQISADNEWFEIINEMNESKICAFTNQAADLYLASCGTEDNRIQLSTKEGDVIYEGSNASKKGLHKHKLKAHIKEFAIGQYLRQFDFKSSEIKFDIEVAPVEVVKKGKKVVSQKEMKNHNKHGEDGFLHLKNGDYIMIKVKNIGSKGAYFSVLDIQGDNKINFIVPSKGTKLTSEDFYLNPGDTFETNFPIRIAPPFGNELIKLIATDKPLNIESALDGQFATRGKKNPHPFESFLDEIVTQSRSSEKAISIETLSTVDFAFKIVN